MTDIALHIHDLRIQFKTYDGEKNVLYVEDLKVRRGTTYGIIGESGTGKTVLALAIQRLLEVPPGVISSGEILLDGEDVLKKTEKEMQKRIRGKKVSMIFQDPMSSLNPVYTVGTQLINVIMKAEGISRREAEKKGVEWLETVKLPDAERAMQKYPHELSGGQRQRVIIALALACGAEFLIADEPTRNLDVTIQAGILQLLRQLQLQLGVTCLFIANNPSLIYAMCDEVAVLQNGSVVEQGNVRQVLKESAHPYTGVLLHAVPSKGEKDEDFLYALKMRNTGEEGACSFYMMCRRRTELCKTDVPKPVDIGDGHFVKCHYAKEVVDRDQ